MGWLKATNHLNLGSAPSVFPLDQEMKALIDHLTKCASGTDLMDSGNSSTLDDNKNRQGGAHRCRQKHKRLIVRPGMRRLRSKVPVVGMAQCRYMIPDHQDKFIPQFGQRTTLQPTAGTAQQLKWIFCRPLIGVLGPFEGIQSDRPVRFRFQVNIHQAMCLGTLSPPALIRGVGYASFKPQPSAPSDPALPRPETV